ncbi:hypothetical protein C1H76_3588 [Elsinoe australis]|uniref:Apple domain-containing protein n=1 Tax=Elsinoe australis TaxID=40998 RepID=A0A4U7B947_9PEZI|nr:hypothetical protein C1H76_3588 [Elsinoe australis]
MSATPSSTESSTTSSTESTTTPSTTLTSTSSTSTTTSTTSSTTTTPITTTTTTSTTETTTTTTIDYNHYYNPNYDHYYDPDYHHHHHLSDHYNHDYLHYYNPNYNHHYNHDYHPDYHYDHHYNHHYNHHNNYDYNNHHNDYYDYNNYNHHYNTGLLCIYPRYLPFYRSERHCILPTTYDITGSVPGPTATVITTTVEVVNVRSIYTNTVYETATCASSFYTAYRPGTSHIPTCIPKDVAHVDGVGRTWRKFPSRTAESMFFGQGNDMASYSSPNLDDCVEKCVADIACAAVEWSGYTCYTKSAAVAQSGTSAPYEYSDSAVLTDSHPCADTPSYLANEDSNYITSACSCLAIPSPSSTTTQTTYASTTVTTNSFTGDTAFLTRTLTSTSFAATTDVTQTRTLPAVATTDIQAPANGIGSQQVFKGYPRANYIPLDTTVNNCDCYPGAPLCSVSDLPNTLYYCQSETDCLTICNSIRLGPAGEAQCGGYTFEGGNKCILHKEIPIPYAGSSCKNLGITRLQDISVLAEPNNWFYM